MRCSCTRTLATCCGVVAFRLKLSSCLIGRMSSYVLHGTVRLDSKHLAQITDRNGRGSIGKGIQIFTDSLPEYRLIRWVKSGGKEMEKKRLIKSEKKSFV